MTMGEEFGIARDDQGTSGYRTHVETPAGIVHLGTERAASGGFGGSVEIVDKFRCQYAGRFTISFNEGRPWEEGTVRRTTSVTCR